MCSFLIVETFLHWYIQEKKNLNLHSSIHWLFLLFIGENCKLRWQGEKSIN